MLEALAGERADRTVFLGDLATLGPAPREVVALVRDLDIDCVMGNHDRFLLEPESIGSYTAAGPILEAVRWCRAALRDGDLDFLRSFSPRLSVPLGPGVTMTAVHGSPGSDTEDLLATTPEEDLDRALAGLPGPLLAAGHTHVQMLRQHRGALVVDPGSVGLPFREPARAGPPSVMAHAEYAVVEADRAGALRVELRRIPLDRAALRAAARAWPLALGAYLVAQYG